MTMVLKAWRTAGTRKVKECPAPLSALFATKKGAPFPRSARPLFSFSFGSHDEE
jgi:hypothetical protein